MATLESGTERFDMGRVVTRTFEVFTRNFLPYSALATICVAPPTFVAFLIARKFPMQLGVLSPDFFRHYAYLLLNAIFSLFLGYFLQAALVQGTITTMNGHPSSLSECLSTAVRVFPRLIGVGIVVIFGAIAGLVLLIVPGLILVTMWAVSAPVCVVEGRTIGGSLSRSAQLTRGHRWAIFGLVIVFWLATVSAGSVVRIVSGIGFMPMRHEVLPTSAFYWFAATLLRVITASLGAVGIASVYYELRTIKEGIGPEQLAAVFA